MRILHCVHSFFPVYGGTTTRVFNLLSNQDAQHFIYVRFPGGDKTVDVRHLKNEEDFGNIHVRRIMFRKDFGLRVPYLNVFMEWNTRKVLNSLRDKNIDLVHGHNSIEFAEAALRYAKRHKLPFIYEEHRLNIDIPKPRAWHWLPQWLYSFLQQFNKLKLIKIFHNVDGVILHSEALKKRIIEVFGVDEKKIYLVPGGIDTEYFEPSRWAMQGRALRRKKGWDGKIVFLYGGYLSDVTGIDFFLETAARLPASIKEKMRIFVIGRGSMAGFVEAFAKKERGLVEYGGLVSYQEMPKYYSACDVQILPATPAQCWEANEPTKILEGMAMEKIVLGSDVGGITDVIRDGENGIIFKGADAESLSGRISFLVEHCGELNSIRKRARQFAVHEKYSWKSSSELLFKAYQEIIEKFKHGAA